MEAGAEVEMAHVLRHARRVPATLVIGKGPVVDVSPTRGPVVESVFLAQERGHTRVAVADLLSYLAKVPAPQSVHVELALSLAGAALVHTKVSGASADAARPLYEAYKAVCDPEVDAWTKKRVAAILMLTAQGGIDARKDGPRFDQLLDSARTELARLFGPDVPPYVARGLVVAREIGASCFSSGDHHWCRFVDLAREIDKNTVASPYVYQMNVGAGPAPPDEPFLPLVRDALLGWLLPPEAGARRAMRAHAALGGRTFAPSARASRWAVGMGMWLGALEWNAFTADDAARLTVRAWATPEASSDTSAASAAALDSFREPPSGDRRDELDTSNPFVSGLLMALDLLGVHGDGPCALEMASATEVYSLSPATAGADGMGIYTVPSSVLRVMAMTLKDAFSGHKVPIRIRPPTRGDAPLVASLTRAYALSRVSHCHAGVSLLTQIRGRVLPCQEARDLVARAFSEVDPADDGVYDYLGVRRLAYAGLLARLVDDPPPFTDATAVPVASDAYVGLLPYVLDLFSTTDQLLVFMDPHLPRAVGPDAWAQIYRAATEVSRSAACPSAFMAPLPASASELGETWPEDLALRVYGTAAELWCRGHGERARELVAQIAWAGDPLAVPCAPLGDLPPHGPVAIGHLLATLSGPRSVTPTGTLVLPCSAGHKLLTRHGDVSPLFYTALESAKEYAPHAPAVWHVPPP